MDIVTYSDLRKDLASFIEKVNEDCTPVFISRKNGDNAVLLSEKDFLAFQETSYLLSSPKNAERLIDSMGEIEIGNAFEMEMIDLEG